MEEVCGLFFADEGAMCFLKLSAYIIFCFLAASWRVIATRAF
jgi:hypothetical protein